MSRRTVTDDEQADGVLWDQSGKLSSKGARLLRGRGKTLGTIDLHVASRVLERRIVLGISQRQMATTLGLTFQQVHKYEQGKSRIQRWPPIRFWEGAGGTYHVLLRGYYR